MAILVQVTALAHKINGYKQGLIDPKGEEGM